MRKFPTVTLTALILLASATASPVPDDFPRFNIPGAEKEMASLRALYWLHYEHGGPLIPLWDEWMPMATLWPARGSGDALEAMRKRWTKALAGRVMNNEGYIHTHQHDGLGHAEGWPFPLWTQAGGIGWHFRGTGIGGYDSALVTPENWIVEGGKGGEVNDKGWTIDLTEAGAVIESPSFSVDTRVAPWMRLNWWATGLEGADCYLEWTTEADPEFSPERRVYFTPADSPKETRTMIAAYRTPEWKGTITGLRVGFDNPGPANVTIKSLHTACDTRHNINNTNFVRGCHDYFFWTRDLTFLRDQIGRVRASTRYMMTEFDTRERKCVYTTWPGHEGRSGIHLSDEGEKTILRGEGIGCNYWDLLPFGGEDSLATIYYFDALLDLAEIEEAIATHPKWLIPTGSEAFDPADLRDHAAEVKEYGCKRFWNEETGRFGTVDLEGELHEYGWTFLNNEAIYYDFCTPEQARSIRAWISGRRVVEGDTSTGADIYHWRFGPRSTTKRNIEYYFWAWSAPESIPWGGQVQDGGGVLGFSYHDLMAILAVDGPDATWERLKEILAWFDETREAGGYREYYKDGSIGTMQGGGTAGGLGLDKEFFESILVPQVMLYGFLGFRPTADGFAMNPRLPKDWPEATITRVHLRDVVMDVTVRGKTVAAKGIGQADEPLVVDLPDDWKLSDSSDEFVRKR